MKLVSLLKKVFCVVSIVVALFIGYNGISMSSLSDVSKEHNQPSQDAAGVTRNAKLSTLTANHSQSPPKTTTKLPTQSPTVTDTNTSKFCNETPSGLKGQIPVDLTIGNASVFHPQLKLGGIWWPADCVPRHRVAFIIPYRDRYRHLQVVLYHLVPIVKRQQLFFQLFVVEQKGKKLFNKGRIMNAAVKEAEKENKGFQCYVFYDVDMIPENDRNMYSCVDKPNHMASAINKFKYKLSYKTAAGGVLNLNRDIYTSVNGYTNLIWGWGSEDDDMYERLKAKKYKFVHAANGIGRYTMIKHSGRPYATIAWRSTMTKTAPKRLALDGFTNVQYNLTEKVSNSSFTYLLVDIGDPPKNVLNITELLNANKTRH